MAVTFNGDVSYLTGEGNSPEALRRPDNPSRLLMEPLVPLDAEYSPTPESEAKVFDDILYHTGAAKFWLLPQNAVDELKAAADELSGLLNLSDSETSVSNLADKTHLLDAIQPLHMKHFLNQTQLEEFEAIMQKWGMVADELNFEPGIWRQALEVSTLSMGGFLLTPEGQKALERQQDVTRLRELYRLARARAEELGYGIDGGVLYRPQTVEHPQAVVTYRRTRRQFIRYFNDFAKDQPSLQIDEFIAQLEQALTWQRYIHSMHWEERLEYEKAGGKAPVQPERSEMRYGPTHYLNEVENAWQQYLDAITQLAELHIVTPELALSKHPDDTGENGSTAIQGAGHFQAYHHLYQQAQALTDRVSEKVDRWVASTANHIQAPVFLFADEQQQYREFLQQQEELYQHARQQAAEHFPGMQFIWYEDIEPSRFSDEYEPQPISAVTRPGFPLREFLLASGEPSQGYLSIHQLFKRTDSPAQKTQLRLALAQEKSFPGERPAEEYAFGEWLRQKGAREIPLGMGLFNEQGQFEIERLEVLLGFQRICVTSLQDETVREHYQSTLQTWLHADQQRQRLIRVDFSYVAQMLRLASWLNLPTAHPLQPQAQSQNACVPQPCEESEKGTDWFETEVQAQWYKAEGSITLKQLHFPPQDRALQNPLKVRLSQAENTPERNLGSYSLGCVLSVNGHLGAKLAFGVNIFDPLSLEVSHANDAKRVEYHSDKGVSTQQQHRQTTATTGVSTTDFNAGETALEAVVGVEAFLGVRAGAQAALELNWAPPEDLGNHLHHYGSMVQTGMVENLGGEWQTLCRSQLMGQAGAGLGGAASFNIAWSGGRFRFHAKASVFFGTGIGSSITLDLDIHKLGLWIAMINQALRDNDYRRLEWVDRESFTLLSQLGFLQTFLQVEVGLLMLRGADSVRSLYRAMTRGQHSGPIAYTLVEDPRQEELKTWLQGFTPEALGALLFTLTQTPRAFEVESNQPGQDNETYSRDQARVLQQQAIARCLGFLVAGAEKEAAPEAPAWSTDHPLPAQVLFTKAVARIHAEGEKTNASSGQAYCYNRVRLDQFMAVQVEGVQNEDAQREVQTYHRYADQLGLYYQGKCEIRRRGGQSNRGDRGRVGYFIGRENE